ncbi:serpin family protein [Hoyosella sp. G463]|uniref:Serpin family protein n=1 Tax=Lolliginicoccus lacisalsi TaxID=2742202 RepID=A0A927JEG6_9ACTN|nr:serpin family protein [Lolliginicoccus lacisalsi]MBD8507779.1 serpin family protein [Lolliginicoccus lacisalsi]
MRTIAPARLALLGAAAALLVSTSCGSIDQSTPATPSGVPGSAIAEMQAARDGIHRFTERFNQEMASQDAANTVYSPLSIATAFAMLRAGAGDATAEQLDALFGYPASGAAPAYGDLLDAIGTTSEPPEPTDPGATRGSDEAPAPTIVALAQGLFVAEDLDLGGEFTETLAAHFEARPEQVDFASSDAVQALNDWASDNTAGRITEMFDQLDPATVAVLANATYMKAEWQVQFSENETSDEEFTRPGGATVTTPMMNKQNARVRHVETPGWTAIALPYRGDELVLWLALDPSDETVPPPAVTEAMLEELARGGTERSAQVALPRFRIDTTTGLLDTLDRIGLTDLGGLDAISPGFTLSDAVHRATITVDEAGTEAAAVTGLAGVTSMPPQSQITFRADQAFAFVLMHQPTGTPLFTGTITDPTG